MCFPDSVVGFQADKTESSELFMYYVFDYVACWLAERMSAPTPKAYLLTPNDAFKTDYAVAIEYIDGFRRLNTVSEEQKSDVTAQLALCLMLQLDDAIQFSCTDEHVYSYDFSEGFNNIELGRILNVVDDAMADALCFRLQQFKRATENVDFDIPGLASDFGLDPEEMKNGMNAAVKRTATITDEEINEMTDELMEVYPAAVAVYYEGYIQAIRDKAKALE
jgi:hypothetical protein